MIEAAAIRIGYRRSEIESLSIEQFKASFKFYRNELELQERGAWERARLTWYYTYAPHDKNIKSPQDLYKFHWEMGRLEKMKPLLDKMYKDKRFPDKL